jgi:hypothetical protein
MRNYKFKIAVVTGVLIVVSASSYILFQKSRNDDQAQLVAKVFSLLSADNLSFDFNGDITKPVKLNIAASSEALKSTSRSTFKLSTPLVPTLGLEGEALNLEGKSYLKFKDPVKSISSLSNDPQTRAIKANLTDVFKKYKDTWIEVDNSSMSEKTIFQQDCLKSISSLKYDESKIISAYKKYRFLKVSEASKTKVNQEEFYKTTFSVNNELPKFLAEVSQKTDPNYQKCYDPDTTYSAVTNLTGNLTSFMVNAKNFNMMFSKIDTNNRVLTKFAKPKKTVKLSSLKKEIESLIITK